MMRAEETGKIRECPVPKPGGLVGQILGVRQEEARERPVVKVEKFNLNSRRIAREQEDGKG
jgi:cytochrome c oxidase assembly factor 2